MPLPTTSTVAAGDLVLLIGRDRRTFVRTVRAGERFECHLGIIQYDDLIGTPYGSQVYTHLQHKIFVLPPHTDDVIRHLKREGQIMFPKDLGYIMLKLGIQPGVRVLEAGTGSGALTLTLALLVGDEGHVYSYERRARMQERALANIRRLGLLHRVTFHQRDIKRGFLEEDLHALFLDVRNPWEYLPQARAALRGGGFFGAIVPTINQVTALLYALYDGPWFVLEVEELLHRTYRTVRQRIRPDDQMVGHTGYLVFARAVHRDDTSEPMPENFYQFLIGEPYNEESDDSDGGSNNGEGSGSDQDDTD